MEQDEAMGEQKSRGKPSLSPSLLTDIFGDAAKSSTNGAGRSTQRITQAWPSDQVLATHSVLNASKTFLASLVLATKFVQDKVYSKQDTCEAERLGR